MNIGDEINDYYMSGIGDLDNIGNVGVIEAIGKDWAIVRDLVRDDPIFTNKSITELEKYF